METGILIAVISAMASLVGAAASFLFSLRREQAGDWRKVKFEHYCEFMTALSGITGSDATSAGHRLFAQASNTIQLVASKRVIDALHDFREEIASSNAHPSTERQAMLLSTMVREIRADLGVPRRSNPDDLSVRLWVSGTNDKG